MHSCDQRTVIPGKGRNSPLNFLNTCVYFRMGWAFYNWRVLSECFFNQEKEKEGDFSAFQHTSCLRVTVFEEAATGGKDRRHPISSKCLPSGGILEVSSALFPSLQGQFCKAVPIFREGKTRPGRSRGRSGVGLGLSVDSRVPSPLCPQVSMNPAPNRALVGHLTGLGSSVLIKASLEERSVL